MQDQTVCEVPIIVGRENIHDLRNLFGVIASARHMLDDALPAARQALLLDAIGDAAVRGNNLTTTFLTPSTPDRAIRVTDITSHLTALTPLLYASAGPHADIRIDAHPGRLPVKLNPASLDAAILELVSNANAALPKPGKIIIRTKRIETHVLLLVADTGCGMSETKLASALRGSAIPAATGTGLGRVANFVRTARGRLRVRSREGTGTVILLELPLILTLASA